LQLSGGGQVTQAHPQTDGKQGHQLGTDSHETFPFVGTVRKTESCLSSLFLVPKLNLGMRSRETLFRVPAFVPQLTGIRT
jgi:hypothetical protein